MKTLYPLLVLSFACSAAFPSERWPQEPTSVFGVPIGAQLAPGTFPTCEEPGIANKYRGTETLCFQPAMMGLPAKLRNVDIPRVAQDVSVIENAGLVQAVVVGFHTDAYSRMKAMLTERYGKPTSVTQGTATTRMNVKVPNETSHWSGAAMSIVIYERSGDIDSGAAEFTSNEAAARRATDERSTVQSGAAKF